MIMLLDMFICMIIILLVLMVSSGIISLLDRKLMAITQLRLGPSMFLFGVLTPIFDGVKLLLKFPLMLLNINLLFLYMFTCMAMCVNYLIMLYMPMTILVIMDLQWWFFTFLAFHTLLFMFDIAIIGVYIITSCFVYLATIRGFLCALLSEFCMFLLFFTFYIASYNLHDILTFCLYQRILWVQYIMGIFVTILCILVMYLSATMNIFEYLEAESELVAGVTTEYSGLFFCVGSLMEIFHTILNSFLLSFLLFGTNNAMLHLLFVIIFMFLLPKIIICSLKINAVFFFVLFFLFLNLLLFIGIFIGYYLLILNIL